MNQPQETINTGKGMPDKTAQEGRARPGRQHDQRDASAEASLELPHERDQSTGMTGGKRSARVEQAGKDVERGLRDTAKGPEMDQTYQKQK